MYFLNILFILFLGSVSCKQKAQIVNFEGQKSQDTERNDHRNDFNSHIRIKQQVSAPIKTGSKK